MTRLKAERSTVVFPVGARLSFLRRPSGSGANATSYAVGNGVLSRVRRDVDHSHPSSLEAE